MIHQVRLLDGTKLERWFPDILILTGPTGIKIDVSPAPHWSAISLDSLDYVEKYGSLSKLSKEKDLFGNEKWQERHFVLSGNSLSYYGSSSDREPKGIIPLTFGLIALKSKGEKRRKDAFQSTSSNPCLPNITATGSEGEFDGVISKSAIALYKPVAQTISRHSGKFSSDAVPRTYYITCDDSSELKDWLHAIDNNIKIASTEATLQTIRRYISQVGGSYEHVDLIDILNRLYTDY